jgi:hypothetical protein
LGQLQAIPQEPAVWPKGQLLTEHEKNNHMQNGSDEHISAHQTSILEISIIALILLVSITWLLWRSLGSGHLSSEPESALIYVGDELVQEVNLGEDRVISLVMNNIQIEVKQGKSGCGVLL